MSPIRSKRYLAGSRGAACTLRIPSVCTGNRETTVPAHIHDGHAGRGIKASDLSVADACFACHEVFDRRAKLPSGELLSDHDWHVYALRGLQETLEARKALGLLTIPEDRARTPADRQPRRDKPRSGRFGAGRTRGSSHAR